MRLVGLSWRRRCATAALLALTSALIFSAGAFADAGNPITGTIKASSTDNGTSLTVYVRGQWNWLSHGSDCNVDRAATGVGIIWNDLNGTGTTRGVNETQKVTITGNPTGGTFKLKFSGQTTGTIAWNATAATVQAALEALSNVAPGDVTVTGGPGPATPWNVTFGGAYALTDVPAMTLANKSFTGGSAPNVTITTTQAGSAPVYNGYLVANGGISAYVGTKTANGLNVQDQMVHPVDRGNQVEGYRTAGTDYPANQPFFDPPSNSITATSTWKGGCGRLPLSAIVSKGNPFGERKNTNCATTPGSSVCLNEPWGSWGYEKCATVATPGGPCTATPAGAATFYGYTHTYNKLIPDPDNPTQMISGLPNRICVNFYDVHTQTQGSYIPKSGDITVDGNGDNSIDTNAFNPNTTAEGGNCIVFASAAISTAATNATAGDAGGIWDDATLTVPAGAGGTITFNAYGPRSLASTQEDCSTTPVYTSTIPVSGPGHYLSKNGSGGVFPAGAGKYDWTADYSGDPGVPFVIAVSSPCGATGETSTVSFTPNPVLGITKKDDLNPAKYDTLGQIVTYTLIATNNGNVTLHNVTVTDNPTLDGFSCLPATPATLAPGASVSCTGTHKITQDDLDNGSFKDTATGKSTEAPDATADDTINADQHAVLDVSKKDDLNPAKYDTLGQIVTYTLTAKNTGNITLHNVKVTDNPTLDGFSCLPATPVAALAPGDSVVCTGTHKITQDDLDNGSFKDTAKGTSNEAPDDTADDTINADQHAVLDVSKKDDLNPAKYDTLGQIVTYTLTAKNTGNITLHNVKVTDNPTLDGFSCLPATPVAALAPGDSVVCTGTHKITQDDLDNGSFKDTAKGTSNEAPDDTADDTINADQHAVLDVSKKDDLNPAMYDTLGQIVTYTLTAKNTGNITLHNVKVTDNPTLDGFSCLPATPVAALAPGDSVVCTGTHKITQDDLDNGSFKDTAKGTSNEAPDDTADDTIYSSPTAVLDVSKKDDLNPAKYDTLGQIVTYTLTAKNTGNITLHNVKVTDNPTLDGFSCLPATPVAALAPGDSVVCTGTHKITQDDLDNGSFKDTAKGTSNEAPDDTADDTINADQHAVLDVSKKDDLNPAKYDTLGQIVTYTLTAKNTGNITLHNVKVTDNPTLDGFSCLPATPVAALAPGDSVVCTGTHKITQDDLDNGSFKDTAKGTSDESPPDEADDTITASQLPKLKLEKSASPLSYVTGTLITYTYLVTNTGNVNFAGDVTVTDDKATVTCPPGPLGVGLTINCTATHTATQGDVDDGFITNTATAHANGTNSNQAQATVTAQTLTTEQNFIPNDAATLGGLSTGAAGNVTFDLYSTTDCSGASLYSQTVPVTGDGTYKTTNSTELKDLLGGSGTAGTYKWQVSYSGDADNPANVGMCGTEQFTVTNG